MELASNLDWNRWSKSSEFCQYLKAKKFWLGNFLVKNLHDLPICNIVLFGLQGYYLSTSRELTRLDSITKAPVIHHFSESISGVMTIRAFGKQTTFYQENVDRVNGNLRMDFHNNGSNEWLGFRLELLGSFTFCLATLFMIMLPSSIIKPGNCMYIGCLLF